MKNSGLFSTIFISEVKQRIKLDDHALGRMATLGQTWRSRDHKTAESLWNSFMKQALSYLQFVPPNASTAPGVYPLYEDWAFSNCLSVLYLIEPGADIDDTAVGRFWPAKLLKELRKQNLNWGILTDGAKWRLYSTKSSRPYEDFVELSLAEVLEKNDEGEYGLFERFFHKDSFIPEKFKVDDEEKKKSEGSSVYKCRLDRDKEDSEKLLEGYIKNPLLYQIDEILQYLCNGFIADTTRRGDEYTEEERKDIFESSVNFLYRCLFLFYAEARRLLPSEVGKAESYSKHSIRALCREAHKFQWGKRKDYDGYDLWKHLKGLTNAVNDGDSDYGIMGYNGGLFDDEQEKYLGRHRLRNDSLSRALYLLAYVEPYNNNPDDEYEIPYEDLEVRHLGELYENILEYTVLLADADRIRRRTKKGVGVLLASETTRQKGDTLIKKGDVYFGETALERKQTGSYYTPEPLVRFLNTKAVVDPLRERFEKEYRKRFNEFLDQASSGQDEGSRKGATRAAIAIVERFVNDVVLDFKVCDPAMGSGHFLVDAGNQMAGLIVELLAEIPNIKGLSTKVTSNPNDWRRLITRNCLYGLDLNPLAVDLAKLSLWLNCFAINHKLTFLDHHLRCGNSLIGIRTLDQLKTVPKRKNEKEKKSKQQVLPYFDDLSKLLIQSSTTIEAIPNIEEDDTDRQKIMFERAHELAFVRLDPLANLYTAYLMDSGITEEQYRELFSYFAAGRNKSQIGDRELKDVSHKVGNYKKKHQFFHWALEFPDVFKKNGMGGFNAAVGNPPWDIVKPNSQEFFSNYDPEFRAYGKQEANRVAEQLMRRNPLIRERWEICCNVFQEQSLYFREPEVYNAIGKGDINTFKLFLEQFFDLLCKKGRMGIVVPSGIYTDQGCQALRELLFDQSEVKFFYCFENRRGIFNIHRSFKFVLFSMEKGGKTDEFKGAFMEHDPDRLPAIDKNALKISVEQVRKFSPNSLSVMEFRKQQDIDIASKIYGRWPLIEELLEKKWSSKFGSEFHMTNDSHLFVNRANIVSSDEFLPLWEGKQIWILNHGMMEATYYIKKSDTAAQFTTNSTRLVYRALASNTNERTLVSSVVAKYFPTGNSLIVCPLRSSWALTLSAIMGSFVLDWLTRGKVTTNLNMFMVEQLPIVDFDKRNISKNSGRFLNARAITARASRLICTSEEFSKVWSECFEIEWCSPTFWYPTPGIPIDSYGPQNEVEIRKHLAEDASSLTNQWKTRCGVFDCTHDRRDNGDRAQLRAEIDAYVAHLYGLSRKEFAYILDTFPVLKRKEEEAFGEYMSKRKCLEEYDRIASIL